MKQILITGGCGFVGASLALRLKRDGLAERIVCLDNLKRRGSELNVARLKSAGISFIHGDIRIYEDLAAVGDLDLLIECSAEPSVLAGFNTAPAYLVQTNLIGTYNCLELVRQREAALCFLSTSRVYPHGRIEALRFTETETRFEIAPSQESPGVGPEGISEQFPLSGPRSMYGATKLASELLIHEYVDMYGIRAVIDRCGLITGPWQFGKVDQGVVVLWVAKHFYREPLSYIGYGGTGKQVRDLLHIEDLYRLLRIQLADMETFTGEVYNVGGGKGISLSLVELTALCEAVTGNTVEITPVMQNRSADLRVFITDTGKVRAATGWRAEIGAERIIQDIYAWIYDNPTLLEGVLR